MVLGDDDKQPTPAQLEQMQTLVRDAMKDGAVGVSTALEYAPAPYAKTEELIALAAEAGKFGGIYATHMRDESDSVLEAIDEALRIGREAHIPVEIWHIKVAGKNNWGRMPEVVAKINAARAAGADVTADTYAYTAWYNDFSAFIPPWAHDGGDAKLVERLKDPATRERIRKDMLTPSKNWDNEWQEIPGPDAIMIGAVENPALLPLQGKRLSEIAKLWNKDPMDALFDFLIQDPSTGVAVFGMSQPDVTLALQQPWVAIDNDSEGTSPEGILGQAHPHPRAYGTFPRILAKYVREEKVLTLEDAIRKFSALPAQRMRLTDRGVLKAGMWADVVIFDPATVHDRATFDNPNQLSGRNGLRAGQRRACDRSRKDDGCSPRQSAARRGICAVTYFGGSAFSRAWVSWFIDRSTRGSASVPVIVNPGAARPFGTLASLRSRSPFNDAVPLS